ncbi:MAG: GGDEF-domain containing protein [Frankiales bacterium]|nr:GGDEF-domain containing protein [Frankiales bacterium]
MLDPRASALVGSIIALAHSLGLRTVAEGVETDVALAELTRLGCDEAQGYYLSRPVPAAELEYWLDRRNLIQTPYGAGPNAESRRDDTQKSRATSVRAS